MGGYGGWGPGKIGENVYGTRHATTQAISKHRMDKNRAEKLQR